MPERRPARPDDALAIGSLLNFAFPGAGEAGLVEALRASGDARIELVAEDEGRIVGHLMLSAMAAPLDALGLGPVATHPDFARQGVASGLIRDGLDEATRAGFRAVFVLGEPRFYHRFGFSTAATRGWRSPYSGTYFMALDLEPHALAAGGEAEYASPFAGL